MAWRKFTARYGRIDLTECGHCTAELELARAETILTLTIDAQSLALLGWQRLRLFLPGINVASVEVSAIDSHGLTYDARALVMARTERFGVYLRVGGDIRRIIARFRFAAINGLKIEATLRRISAMEYFWHAAKRGLFVRPIDCWRGFFKAPDQLLISEHFPTRQVLTHPFGQYLLGTDILFTIRDWQKKACEIESRARTAIEKRQAYPRFPLLGEPGVLVTAIASLYNGGAFISRFMENIVSQSIFKSHCELIIIDANSPDNEHEVIRKYLDQFSNITYIRTADCIGIYEAWNLALSRARGRYITNTNVDDVRRSDSFELQASTLDNVKFADVVYQDFFYSFDRNFAFDQVAEVGVVSRLPIVCPNNLINFNSPHHAPMWRRSLHDDVGLFDATYKSAGDWEFWLRCARAGKQFYKLNDPHLVYYANPEGISTGPESPGVEEGARAVRSHARKLLSRNLVSSHRRFVEEVHKQSGLSAESLQESRPSAEWRYSIAQRALRRVSLASRDIGKRDRPDGPSPGGRVRLVVDGVFFQRQQSGIARLWASVLPELLNRWPYEIILLDRGGDVPDLPGVKRIPFPSHGARYNAQDSLLLENICQLHAADIFLSTYHTTPLCTPSLCVVYDMIPERLGWDLGERIWAEKELAISHGRGHLCVSQRTRLDLLAFYPELDRGAVDLAYCGVDADTFAPAPPAAQETLRRRLGLRRPFYILVGTRRGYKNSRLFFDAVTAMQDVDFDVLCVGGEPELEAWIAELPTKTCRVARVELTDPDLAVAYAAAEALIYPSLYEGFGMPVIEAMACGCPVITTARGALPEAAGNAAYVIDGRSVLEMIEAVRAVRVPEIREGLKLAGARHAAKFRWGNFADVLAGNVQRIIDEAKAGKFAHFNTCWTRLRMLQNEVDVDQEAWSRSPALAAVWALQNAGMDAEAVLEQLERWTLTS